MKIEDKYILELCKFIYPNKIAIESMMKKPLNYQYILGQLLYNRMGVVAYYTLLKSNLLKDTNREFRNTLKIIFESGVSKTDALHTSLGYLYTILKDVDFNYAILKGSFLVNLYPDGLRTSNDIDILISPENITDLSKMLISSGFKQGFIHNNSFVQANRKEIINSRMNRGETIPFIKELNMPNIKYLELDVNFSLDFKSGNDKEIVRSLLNDANELKRSRLKTLNEIDFLIHLCTHLFKEATVMAWVNMGRDLSLYITERKVYSFEKGINIAFDINYYLGVCDYELEIEFEYSEKETAIQLMKKLSLKSSRPIDNKSTRFLKRLNRLDYSEIKCNF